ncbi:glycoside hydrolase [Rhodovulum sulfidophilum]|uniref:Glycoside hydrolase n=1 Tax=Rhodovulum visakhapatnamense TaxID=364297 RepID=A0ABS1REG5_9RHOB|nr:GH25 family lysozyme [Rhodovulum visakhapatnamense]MBL3570485.1 glycoside hydrolase [Rhodovulum visakhapatnamense]MBL3578034.1 glycoside hydrolase [Rhodovulum visakhapatnamense]OLS44545.1 glycoside hydrolase [Rhodovulum sulfidophilum]
MPHKTLVLLLALSLMSCGPSSPERQTPRAATAEPHRAAPLRLAAAERPRFDDHDPHDWTGAGPRAYPVHGIDVSRWQGAIDWPKLRKAGVSFVYVKATEGMEDSDPMFRAHWTGAGRAGVARAAYHHFYFCARADRQARWFIANVPRSADGLPHMLDMEWNPFSPTCRLRPDAATVRAEAATFLDIVERHYGRRPVIYTTVDFARDTGITRLPGTGFWLRSVAGPPETTYPGTPWTFWQYTGTGRIDGVAGPVDINVFRGSEAAWQVWDGQGLP